MAFFCQSKFGFFIRPSGDPIDTKWFEQLITGDISSRKDRVNQN